MPVLVFRPGQSIHPSIRAWKMAQPVEVKVICSCSSRWPHRLLPDVGLGMSRRPLDASGVESSHTDSTGPVEAPLFLLV